MRRNFSFPLLLAALTIFPVSVPRSAAQEKTVEQVKKNIQVLKGLPASQFSLVMDYVSASLGVECSHCHVIDTTGWYMEKDDKPAKNKARKMMQMVMDLNTKTFGGREAVTCYTCHRGAAVPARIMPLPLAAALPAHEDALRESALPSAELLLAKYEAALGGPDAIAAVRTRVSTGVTVDGEGKESPLEIVQAAQGRYLSRVTVREGVTRAIGYNGTAGWMSSPRGVRELPPEAIDDLKRDASLFPLARLREHAGSMHVTGRDTVNGATAYCVAVPGTSATELLYFDAESGLLLRQATMTETMIGTIPEQTDFFDYRTVDGVKVPFAVRTAAVDAHDGAMHRFTAVQQNAPVDESIFAMPAVKK